MPKCASCSADARDVAQCSSCMLCYDFNCAGITEGGFRKLGDRKTTWKCPRCKGGSTPKLSSSNSPSPSFLSPDSELLMSEIKKLSSQLAALAGLAHDVKAIKEDIQQLKSSVEFAHESSKLCKEKLNDLEIRVSAVEANHEENIALVRRVSHLEDIVKQKDQTDRLNNAEIKGIPYKDSENLIETIMKLGSQINCKVTQPDINYIVRVPTRNDQKNKNIIVNFNNRYLKENFVACARAHKNVSATQLGFVSESKIFVNDHLTIENKILLNKAKKEAKDRGYSFVWVKNCKIFVRKNPTSPIKNIKSDLDLKKL
ncbi:uncharacterized protein LOC135076453 [Ostrinia nubilalis]|uniref:uncharacterized protein LOC135076453 n=1 Tax=Ostrinia nubilalis TaxID=29057 RepID=UPI0030824F7A